MIWPERIVFTKISVQESAILLTSPLGMVAEAPGLVVGWSTSLRDKKNYPRISKGGSCFTLDRVRGVRMGLKRGGKNPQISIRIIKLKKCFEYIVWCSGLDRHGIKERICADTGDKNGETMAGHILGNLRNGQQHLERSQARDLGVWDELIGMPKKQEDLLYCVGASSCANSEPCITSLILLDVVT